MPLRQGLFCVAVIHSSSEFQMDQAEQDGENFTEMAN